VRRILRAGAVVAVVAAAALGLALTLEFESPRLGRAALDRVAAATGARVSAQRFRLRPLRGLVLQGVEARRALDGAQVTATVEELVFDHRLLSLLRRRLEVDRIVVKKPAVRMVEERGARAPRLAPSGLLAATALALHVSSVDVRDGTVEMMSGRRVAARLSGLDLELRDLELPATAGLAGLRGRGRLRVDELRAGTGAARSLAGDFRIEGGELRTESLRFALDAGGFAGTVAAPLGRVPTRYEVSLASDRLDLNALAGMGKDGRLGPARVSLRARGQGAGTESLEGRGTLTLEAGTLPSTPLFQAVDAVLGARRFVGARYRATTAPFRLARGRVWLDGLRVEGDGFASEVTGSVAFAGSLDLGVAVRTPRSGLAARAVPVAVLDAMTGADGQVLVALRVTGTQAAPRITPDAGAMAAQARDAGTRRLAERAGRALGGLFRRTP
jgi:uncharacterized protein involved in outer membrane biogenesis